MSSLAIRRAARAGRRHGAALVAALAVSCALAVHHTGPPIDGMHHDGAMGAMVELCLAVFVAVGTAAAAVAVGFVALGRWRPARDLPPTRVATHAAAPAPRSRAGPVLLSLLCVSRR